MKIIFFRFVEDSCSGNLIFSTFAAMKKKITGIILSGGKSCRMGKDKGLCMLGDRPMISFGLAVLEDLCEEILISANDDEYLRFGHTIVKDEVKNIGPLGGLYSSIRQAGNEDILVLSCDMPFVNTALFEHLLRHKGNALAAIPEFQGWIEPTCGYYRKEILSIIKQQIDNQEYSLRTMLEKANYKKVQINEQMPLYTPYIFSNINEQTDMFAAESHLAKQQ